MRIDHVFSRILPDGREVTAELVADITGVHLSTAYRWRAGNDCSDVHDVAALYTAHVLTDDDLALAGFARP